MVVPIPSGEVPGATLTNEILNFVHIDTVIFPPHVLSDMAQNPVFRKTLRRLESAHTGSAAISSSIANLITCDEGPPLHNLYSSTENWPYFQHWDEPSEVPYMSFHPLSGCSFQPETTDLYQLVVERRPELEGHQAVFMSFPNLKKYESGDLFSPHPSRSGLWLSRGRVDEMLALKPWGVKMFVTDVEETLQRHGLIQSVLIGNIDFREPVALVESFSTEHASSASECQRFVDQIWPAVEATNQSCDEVTQIARNRIIIASKPFVRTLKKSIDRPKTLQLFESEIRQIYDGNTQGFAEAQRNGLKFAQSPNGLQVRL